MRRAALNYSRRKFLITAASVSGGLMLGVTLPTEAMAASVKRQPWGQSPPHNSTEFTPWITIGKDSTVTIRVATPDIGNGVMTQALMIVTEELNCDWNNVRAEYASPNRNYVDGQVYSKEMGYAAFFARSTGPKRVAILLQAGASARERLKEAAAQIWDVPRSEILAKDSLLTHANTNRRLTYGDVAEKAGSVQLESEPVPKPRDEWWFLGKANPRKVQQPLIARGAAVYGIDVKVPNMVHAALMQSPAHGGRLKHFDFDKVRNMPGVLGFAVVDPTEQRPAIDPKLFPFGIEGTVAQSGIAIVAEHYWQARKALDAMPVEWEDGPGAMGKPTIRSIGPHSPQWSRRARRLRSIEATRWSKSANTKRSLKPSISPHSPSTPRWSLSMAPRWLRKTALTYGTRRNRGNKRTSLPHKSPEWLRSGYSSIKQTLVAASGDEHMATMFEWSWPWQKSFLDGQLRSFGLARRQHGRAGIAT
jgi:hypothetical protein